MRLNKILNSNHIIKTSTFNNNNNKTIKILCRSINSTSNKCSFQSSKFSMGTNNSRWTHSSRIIKKGNTKKIRTKLIINYLILNRCLQYQLYKNLVVWAYLTNLLIWCKTKWVSKVTIIINNLNLTRWWDKWWTKIIVN